MARIPTEQRGKGKAKLKKEASSHGSKKISDNVTIEMKITLQKIKNSVQKQKKDIENIRKNIDFLKKKRDKISTQHAVYQRMLLRHKQELKDTEAEIIDTSQSTMAQNVSSFLKENRNLNLKKKVNILQENIDFLEEQNNEKIIDKLERLEDIYNNILINNSNIEKIKTKREYIEYIQKLLSKNEDLIQETKMPENLVRKPKTDSLEEEKPSSLTIEEENALRREQERILEQAVMDSLKKDEDLLISLDTHGIGTGMAYRLFFQEETSSDASMDLIDSETEDDGNIDWNMLHNIVRQLPETEEKTPPDLEEEKAAVPSPQQGIHQTNQARNFQEILAAIKEKKDIHLHQQHSRAQKAQALANQVIAERDAKNKK